MGRLPRVRSAARYVWDGVGVGANLHGRFGFVSFVVLAAATAFTGLRRVVGPVTALIMTVCAVGALIGLWMAIAAVRQNERDAALPPTGTLIPPGHAAIITGQQLGEGQWVPPGYDVTHGPGTVTDDTGNTAAGADARIYGGTGNTVMGARSGSGVPPWCRPTGVRVGRQ